MGLGRTATLCAAILFLGAQHAAAEIRLPRLDGFCHIDPSHSGAEERLFDGLRSANRGKAFVAYVPCASLNFAIESVVVQSPGIEWTVSIVGNPRPPEGGFPAMRESAETFLEGRSLSDGLFQATQGAVSMMPVMSTGDGLFFLSRDGERNYRVTAFAEAPGHGWYSVHVSSLAVEGRSELRELLRDAVGLVRAVQSATSDVDGQPPTVYVGPEAVREVKAKSEDVAPLYVHPTAMALAVIGLLLAGVAAWEFIPGRNPA